MPSITARFLEYMHIACARGVSGSMESMDQGNSGSVSPEAVFIPPIPAAPCHTVYVFARLKLSRACIGWREDGLRK